jgi:hypothetical protein
MMYVGEANKYDSIYENRSDKMPRPGPILSRQTMFIIPIHLERKVLQGRKRPRSGPAVV